ncbi:MAG: prepilin-type N-terminal cleavage/methylation domain-containing protein [Defluviitaleaceae bacterium]|nr:prepilin-type N-terminal cleavage/methylation domain-containing protein [Defluviitaleaceae bacterium]
MRTKKNNGLTLTELIIVLAILAIIAAILIPMFLMTTDRARLRADIQSAIVIQNALDLYRIERGRSVAESIGTPNPPVDNMIAYLVTAERINRNVQPQSSGATWTIHPTHNVIAVDIRLSPQGVQQAFDNLSEDERRHVVGN